MTIVAGLYYGREVDRQSDVGLDLESVVGLNAAIVLGPFAPQVITKQHPAESEPVAAGTGPTVIEVTSAAGRSYRLGAAICLDYLHVGHTFASQSDDVDVVAITALSADTSEFHPVRSRDFVRVIANHAYYGGSSVYLPGIKAAAFGTPEGVDLLPAQTEGVVIVDFDRFQTRRSATRATQNQLVARAPLLYRGLNPAADEIADELVGLKQADLVTALDDSRLSAWIEMLEPDPAYELLRQSVMQLRGQRRASTLTDGALELLGRHVSLADVRTIPEVRFDQAGHVVRALRSEIDRDPPPQGSGEAWEAYKNFRDALGARVRPALRQGAARISSARGDVQQIFAISLGTFDADDAVGTLPRQLNVLRTFSDAAPAGIVLDYRLHTSRDVSTDQMAAYFAVSCTGVDATERVVEDLRSGLHDQLRVVLVEAWALTAAAVEPVLSHEHIVEIRPAPGSVPPVKEDWSLLVDLLRRLETPASVQLLCGAVDPTDYDKVPRDDAAAVPPVVSSETEMSAGAFLSSVGNLADGGARNLGLRLLVGSDEPLGEWLPRAIGHELLGSVSFELQELAGSPPVLVDDGQPPAMVLTPEHALRILHPPYGQIQGRGLRGRRATRIPVPAVAFPREGLELGSATRQTGRSDETVEARLDAEARLRHLYIVGKTGSGKTNLLKNLARQDIQAGRGVAVIDPHGALVEYLLAHAGERRDDVLLLDFGRRDYVPVLNPLDLDAQSATDVDLAIEEFIDIMVRRHSADYTGPVFEDMIRLALETFTHPRFPHAPSILYTGEVYRSQKARKWLETILKDDELGDQWATMNQMTPSTLAEHIKWLLAKFAEMSREGVLRSVLGGHRSTVSIEEVVYGGGVTLVRLPETTIGPKAASFIGSLIFSRIRRALFDPERRTALGMTPSPLHLYVDEFQKFVGGGFEQLVAEARKFGLGLTVAHQNLRQLEAFSRFEGSTSNVMLESLLGNVGNMAVMRVGRSDGERLARELEVSDQAVARIGQFEALCRAVVDQNETDAFSLIIEEAAAEGGHPPTGAAIAADMIRKGRWIERDQLSSEFEKRLGDLRAEWTARDSGASRPDAERGGERSSFLDDFMARRRAARPGGWKHVEAIDGVGPAVLAKLRERFGTFAELQRAAPDEIAKTHGIGRVLAQRIFDALRSAGD